MDSHVTINFFKLDGLVTKFVKVWMLRSHVFGAQELRYEVNIFQ